MNVPAELRDLYFYLSHPHTPSRPFDHWVQIFYQDLRRSVASLAKRGADMDIGFVDDMKAGPARDTAVEQALSRARVFVPLYSPVYFERFAARSEQAIFRQRLSAASVDPALGHIQPVLWMPLAESGPNAELEHALQLGHDFEDYVELGLGALCRLRAYRVTYQIIVQRLAQQIVTVAEESSLVPAALVSPAVVPDPSSPEIPFVIAVIAPTENHLPARRQPTCYGMHSFTWQPFGNNRDMPVADIVSSEARRLQLPARVVDFVTGDPMLETCPGVILVDPWILDRPDGRSLLRAAVERMQQWVTLMVVVDRTDPQYEERGFELAQQAMRLGVNASQIRYLARDIDEFLELIKKVVRRTRRRYLHQQPAVQPEGPSGIRPRLRESRPWQPPTAEEER